VVVAVELLVQVEILHQEEHQEVVVEQELRMILQEVV
jgi:hypothetical protein|tara:strand:- start:178 stop:288 length:111 start_codon:yes stop_codon:yes gene_type:complete